MGEKHDKRGGGVCPHQPPCVVVAGHVCVDVIPAFKPGAANLADLLVPGNLIEIGPAVLATGGTVPNTGLALHRLGVQTRLVGKVGCDAFGDTVCTLLRGVEPALADYMVRDASSATSYSIVVNYPGFDRVFLHCPGANDTFTSDDVSEDVLCGADVLHFGYPPLMRHFYADGGGELARLFARVRAAGLTTSLDMALPDPGSAAGQADWSAILARTLPFVDVFCPSLDEIAFMLDPEKGRHIREATAAGVPLGGLDANAVQALSTRLIAWGAAVVMLKLGRFGAFLHVTEDDARLAATGRYAASLRCWRGAALYAPCFEASVAGTTGSGDCTIAGLLAALTREDGPRDALRAAVATGSASVEQMDATSGVPPWSALAARLVKGWGRDPALSFPDTV